MRTGGKFWLPLREMTACLVLLWLNKTSFSLPSFRSLERSEAEMFLWSVCMHVSICFLYKQLDQMNTAWSLND